MAARACHALCAVHIRFQAVVCQRSSYAGRVSEIRSKIRLFFPHLLSLLMKAKGGMPKFAVRHPLHSLHPVWLCASAVPVVKVFRVPPILCPSQEPSTGTENGRSGWRRRPRTPCASVCFAAARNRCRDSIYIEEGHHYRCVAKCHIKVELTSEFPELPVACTEQRTKQAVDLCRDLALQAPRRTCMYEGSALHTFMSRRIKLGPLLCTAPRHARATLALAPPLHLAGR